MPDPVPAFRDDSVQPTVPAPSRHQGIRLSVLELTRATEQTAVSVASHAGRFGWGHPALRTASLRTMFGYLQHAALSSLRIKHPDERDIPAYSPKLGIHRIGESLDYQVRLKEPIPNPHLNVDLCISPIDGKELLSEGLSNGSISVMAGVEQGGFLNPFITCERVTEPPSSSETVDSERSENGDFEANPDTNDRYLVITLNQSLVRAKAAVQIKSRLAALDSTAAHGPVRTAKDLQRNHSLELGHVLHTAVNLEDVAKLVAAATQTIPAAVVLMHRMNQWIHPLARHFRLQVLQGSSVGAAISVLIPGAESHISFAIARRTHVIIAAVAAAALGGEIIAVPLRKWGKVAKKTKADKKKNSTKTTAEFVHKGYELFEPSRIFHAEQCVSLDKSSFVIATGITSHPSVPGVRFEKDGAVVTSLCLSTKTGSVRTIEHRIDLKRYSVFGEYGEGKMLDKYITEMKPSKLAGIATIS